MTLSRPHRNVPTSGATWCSAARCRSRASSSWCSSRSSRSSSTSWRRTTRASRSARRTRRPTRSTGWAPTTAATTCCRCVIFGARVSLIVGFAGAAVAMLIGGAVGHPLRLLRRQDRHRPDAHYRLLPGDSRRAADDRRGRRFGRNLANIVIIIGVIYWASTARLIRAQVITVRERIYVKRARALGSGNRRIISPHVLPQVMPLIVANTVLMVAIAMFAETYISFLGLGDPATISWGKLIQNSLHGRRRLTQRLVGDHPARPVRDGRHPGLHDGGTGDGGCAQPAAARSATCRCAVSGCGRWPGRPDAE